ncbi:MAG: hypothetical protein PWQ84_1587 [Thermotogaceae bacterium]|nr:hypothetical protein [Thermotogaceae bacterium]
MKKYLKLLVLIAGIVIFLNSVGFSNEVTQSPNAGEMILVKAGTFMMGNTRDDSEGESDEKPVHEVELTYDYEIGKYEVTNAEFIEFLNDAGVSSVGKLNGHRVINMYDIYCEFEKIDGTFKLNPEGKNNYPVIHVTWWGTMEYCNWLSFQEDLAKAYDIDGNLLDSNGNETTDITKVEGYRLPTEAEWEYAARGAENDINTKTDYKFAGSNDMNLVGWYLDNSENNEYPIYSGRGTHHIGQKEPNEIGLYDMSGNAYEWCLDWYTSDYYIKSPRKNPVNLESSFSRILRGGGLATDDEYCRVSNHGKTLPTDSGYYLGFRIARKAD